MKKATSMLLALALLLGSFTGCGEKASSSSESASTPAASVSSSPALIDMEEEPYTVAIQVVTLPGAQFEGKEPREEAINAITVPAINAKVQIQEVWINEIVNKTSMAVAGNEKVDLIHVATVNNLSSLVGSDILLDMNEDNLLQTHGQDLVALFGDLLKSGYANEQQLAVPAKVFNATSKGIMYNKDLLDAAKITMPEKITLDELDTILYEFKAANSEVMPFLIGEGNLNFLYWLVGYEGFGAEASYGAVLDSSKSLKVENIYATDLFRDFCLRMYRWKQDGIIPGDPTDTTPAQTYYGSQQLLTSAIDLNPDYKTSYSSTNEFNVGYTSLVDPIITNSNITEYMWGIASNSERPDKAMDFLNFMYTNSDVANILKYGLKDVNYTYAEGSTEIIVTNNTYNPLFFFGGDTSKMATVFPASEDFHDQQAAFEKSARISPICDYSFNDSAFQTESAVIYSTILEYLPRLQNGMAESEEATLKLIEEFVARLETSGINDVIAANQKQLDEWSAKP